MWLILPVGHDQGVRRFPWVTASIVALCLLLQLHRSFFGASEEQVRAAIEERASIEEEVVLEHRKAELSKLMADEGGGAEKIEETAKSIRRGTDGTLEKFRSGELTGKDDPRYVKWLATKSREEAVRRSDLAERLAYRPSSGLSLGLLTSAFVHAGWLHLIGNMLFLYLVGCNLEDRWGRGVFAGFYLAGCVASAGAYGLWHPNSEVGVVGASGAIAAGMGAFLICFHNTRIKLLIVSLYRPPTTMKMYAFWALPAWFLEQAMNSWFESYGAGAVAYSAHVGGFLFGLATAITLKASKIESRYLLPATAEGVEWQEDPEFLHALDLLKTKDKKAAALPLLQSAVRRQPRHEHAWLELTKLALSFGDTGLTAAALASYVGCLPRDRLRDAVKLVRETHLLDKKPPLNDRTLSTLVRAAAAEGDAELTVEIARRLIAGFPRSPFMPGMLWEVALVQERAGETERAIKNLNQLIARYPNDPFAERARTKLGRSRETPAPEPAV